MNIRKHKSYSYVQRKINNSHRDKKKINKNFNRSKKNPYIINEYTYPLLPLTYRKLAVKFIYRRFICLRTYLHDVLLHPVKNTFFFYSSLCHVCQWIRSEYTSCLYVDIYLFTTLFVHMFSNLYSIFTHIMSI